jgi:hypothetical protein
MQYVCHCDTGSHGIRVTVTVRLVHWHWQLLAYYLVTMSLTEFMSIMAPRKRSERSSPGTSSKPKSRPTRSTASTIGRLPSGNDGVLKLQCLIEGESTVFEVRVPHASATVGDLKEDIQKKRELGVLKGVDPVTLELWKVCALDKVKAISY